MREPALILTNGLQSGWLGAGEAGAVQLAGAVVDLLIGPLWPSAALPEGHLQQYQVRDFGAHMASSKF